MRRIAALAAALLLFLPGTSPAQVVVTAPDPAGVTVVPAPLHNPSDSGPSDSGRQPHGGAAGGAAPVNRLTPSAVPEPSTLLLTTVAMVGLGAAARLRWAARWRRELEKGGD